MIVVWFGQLQYARCSVLCALCSVLCDGHKTKRLATMTTPDPTLSAATAAASSTKTGTAKSVTTSTAKTKRKRAPSSSTTTTKRKKKQPSSSAAAKGGTSKTKGATKAKRSRSPVPSVIGSSSSSTIATPLPTHTLIIDNGGHTLKYGLVATAQTPQSDSSSPEQQQQQQQQQQPSIMPNLTGRLRHQITVLKGDEIDQVQPNQLQVTTRSMERGYITNMGNQIQVWKRLLDNLGIQDGINLNGEASQAFGWKMLKSNKKQPKNAKGSTSAGGTAAAGGDGGIQQQSQPPLSTKDLAVLILLPPHCPRILLDQIAQVWFEDFGIAHVGFALSAVTACVAAATPVASKHRQISKTDTGCCCMVDAGWSGIDIVPTFLNKPLAARSTAIAGKSSKASSTTIRRLPLGGKHLTNILKYHVSYRQWNLMDQEWILQDVMEKLSYFSLDFQQDMKVARKVPKGQRPWDRDYVLPDMQTTFHGQVRLTQQLLYMQQQKEQQKLSEEQKQQDEEDELDEDYQEGDDDDNNGGSDNEDDGGGDDNSDKNGDDNEDEEETDAQIRRRVMRQRQEEEQRRKEIEAEQQILNISVERFATPEVLFSPSDVGLPTNMGGLAHGIVQSITSCPKKYHAALFGNVVVTGGISQITNFQSRLEQELRSLTPCQYPLHITQLDSPITQSWVGAREWLRSSGSGETKKQTKAHYDNHEMWRVSRDEWEQSKKDPKKRKQCLSRFLSNTGSVLV